MEIITTKELTYYARKGWTVWQHLQYRKLIKAEAKQFNMTLDEYEKCLGTKGIKRIGY
jgi:hypothetical protein